MAKSIRSVDVTNNGTTTQLPLIVDRNAQNEEAVARSLYCNDDIVSTANRLPVTVDRLPPSLGQNTSGNSLPVTLSTDGVFASAFGKSDDSSALSDSANTGFISLIKRLLSQLTSLFQGTAGSPNSNVISVQGIAGATALPVTSTSLPLPIGAATEASLDTVNNKLPALITGRMPVDVTFPVIQAVAAPARSFFSNYSTATRAGSSVLKNSAGRLVSLDIFSVATTSTSILYLQFFDSVTIPATTTRCKRFFPILPDNTLLVYGATDLEFDFTTGIVVAISTTPDTYTPGVQADFNNIYFTITFR